VPSDCQLGHTVAKAKALQLTATTPSRRGAAAGGAAYSCDDVSTFDFVKPQVIPIRRPCGGMSFPC
jgi:hypothetical protein